MYVKLIGVFLASILLAGCWDNLEVEKRGFVTGIAMDVAQNNSDSKDEQENNSFELTQQLINPSTVGSAQNQSANQTKSPFRNLTQTGDTIIEMNRDMIKQAGRITNVTHLNVVLFSEELVRQEQMFADLIDIFLREKEMLRSVKIAVTQKRAGEYLAILPENEKGPSQYISNILQNKSNLDIAEPLTVGHVQANLLSNKSFVIPLLSKINEQTINYEGLSIYNGTKHQVVGTLTGNEAKGLNFMQAINQTGTINSKTNQHEVTFEVLNVKSKLKLQNRSKEQLKFNLTIHVEAGIAEQFGALDIMNEHVYEQLLKAIEHEIKQMTEQTIYKLQHEYTTDVIGLNTHLYKYEYPLWEAVKSDWEQGQHYFQKSHVSVDVKATIEKPGNVIKSH